MHAGERAPAHGHGWVCACQQLGPRHASVGGRTYCLAHRHTPAATRPSCAFLISPPVPLRGTELIGSSGAALPPAEHRLGPIARESDHPTGALFAH